MCGPSYVIGDSVHHHLSTVRW